NMAAYDAFLKGEAASGGMSAVDPLSLRKAMGFYEQAAALDPKFVEAWVRVSTTNSSLYYYGLPTRALDEAARLAAEKAVALAPKRPEGYQAMGDYYRAVRGDFPKALEQYAKGRSLGAPNVDLLVGMALAEASSNRWDASIDALKQAARLDPRSVTPLRRLGDELIRTGRFAGPREGLD